MQSRYKYSYLCYMHYMGHPCNHLSIRIWHHEIVIDTEHFFHKIQVYMQECMFLDDIFLELHSHNQSCILALVQPFHKFHRSQLKFPQGKYMPHS